MARSSDVYGVTTPSTKATLNGATNVVDGVSNNTPDPTVHAGNPQHLKEVDIDLKDLPAYTSRKLRVVTIGAGYSGLTLAHKFQHQHSDLGDNVDHTIYEARSELGGTWLVNTYPGVVCDVPSHIYVRFHKLCQKLGMIIADYQRRSLSIPILAGLGSIQPGQKFGHI